MNIFFEILEKLLTKTINKHFVITFQSLFINLSIIKVLSFKLLIFLDLKIRQ